MIGTPELLAFEAVQDIGAKLRRCRQCPSANTRGTSSGKWNEGVSHAASGYLLSYQFASRLNKDFVTARLPDEQC
ncbi:hypothetical protein Trydic_g4168 [Trypoxylus dichotomus]